MVKRFVVAVMLLCVGNLPVAAFAQSSDPSWLDSLRLQLTVDLECEVRYFLNIREREGDARNTYSARVQCEDGRQFDATRTDPAADFKIEICGQAVCDLERHGQDKS